MTSFDPLHPNTGAIIELLAEYVTLSTKELSQKLIEEKGIEMSHANFYKTLSKLIKNQMLVKTGEQVSLNMIWATTIYKYGSLMNQQKEGSLTAFPPFKEGEKRTFDAESLDKIDPIWTHLVLYLFTQEEDPIIHVYHSHPWYILGRPDTERRMYDSCYTQGKKVHILYGNTTFLDQYGYQLHKTTPCDAFITNDPPFLKEGYGFWLCGDYIIECFFPALISQYLGSFFESTKNVKEFDLNTFSSIFHIKVPVQLQVSRDKKKAAQLRKLFETFCGEKNPRRRDDVTVPS